MLLFRIATFGLGLFLLVGGAASVVLGALALGENPAKGIQVLLLSLLLMGAGAYVIWEAWRGRRPADPEDRQPGQSGQE